MVSETHANGFRKVDDLVKALEAALTAHFGGRSCVWLLPGKTCSGCLAGGVWGGLPRLTADQNVGATGERYGSGQRFWNSRHPGPQLSDQTDETPGPGRSRTSEVLKLPRSRFLAVSDRTQQ